MQNVGLTLSKEGRDATKLNVIVEGCPMDHFTHQKTGYSTAVNSSSRGDRN